MRIEESVYLDFDDVLIKPKRSFAASRKDVNLIRSFKLLHSKKNISCFPLIAANMTSTGTIAMGTVTAKYNALCSLHKFYDTDIIIDELRNKKVMTLIPSFGIRDTDIIKLRIITKYAIKYNIDLIISIDVANGYTQTFCDVIKQLRNDYPDIGIMAGTVASAEMTQELIMAGADIVRVGIGSGSNCTTRKIAAIGVPQLSCLIECSDCAHGLGGLVCSDGGCKVPADVCKAYGAGADFVMLGNGMLGGTDECDGEWIYENSPYELGYWNSGLWSPGGYPPNYQPKKKAFKAYGMSSLEAMQKHYGGKADYCAPEGKTSIVPYRGSAANIIEEIMGGLRSCCAYVGASSLKDLSKCTTFIKVNRTHNTVFGD